jgi:hypothetical protein
LPHRPLIGQGATIAATIRVCGKIGQRGDLNFYQTTAFLKDVTMPVRGIYQKSCPSCAKQVAIDADRCACGYSFVAGIDVAEVSEEDQLAQDTLVEEYIHARIGQALTRLQSLQSELLMDPKNLDKAGKLMRAFADVRELRAELDEHRARAGRSAATQPSAQPTQAFRAAQAQKAEQAMHDAGISTKTCPKCQAVLPIPAALCFCGHGFGVRSAGPTTDEVAASGAKLNAPR